MPPIVGHIIIIAVLVIIVGFSIRALWKSHKSGRCCGCNSKECSCGGECHCSDQNKK